MLHANVKFFEVPHRICKGSFWRAIDYIFVKNAKKPLTG